LSASVSCSFERDASDFKTRAGELIAPGAPVQSGWSMGPPAVAMALR
jgi:hypothetical protein